MSFDFWKPFRRCFLCKGFSDVMRRKYLFLGITQDTQFHYYHEECYQKVIQNSEQISKVIDVVDSLQQQYREIRETRILNDDCTMNFSIAIDMITKLEKHLFDIRKSNKFNKIFKKE
jgi:hypothetical protein